MNQKFYKLKLLQQYLNKSTALRNRLFEELSIHATDPTVYKRRFRMLKQLSEFDAQIIMKIHNFDSQDPSDFDVELFEIFDVVNRSA